MSAARRVSKYASLRSSLALNSAHGLCAEFKRLFFIYKNFIRTLTNMITIFTPTYNRAYILPELYKSLCRQTNKDFEWLVIDDGSTDNTNDLIQSWKADGRVRINYVKTENRGKSSAINTGVNKATGDIFFIVDSDDYLTDDAIDSVAVAFSGIRNLKHYCGICFQRGRGGR